MPLEPNSTTDGTHSYLVSKVLGGNTLENDQALQQLIGLDSGIAGECFLVLIVVYKTTAQAKDICAKLQKYTPKPGCNLVAAQVAAPEQIVLILSGNIDDEQTDRLQVLLEGYVYLATGDMVKDPANISHSYNTACLTLDYLRLKGIENKHTRYIDLPERVFSARSYPMEIMQSLESAITHANNERLAELITQIEALLTVDGAPPYFTRSVYFYTINLLISGLMRYLGEGNDTVEKIGMRSMLSHYTVQEMVNILYATSAQLSQIMQENVQKYSPMVDVLTYIDSNISSSDLSLQITADHIGMSASAFSRSFKEKVGRNFKEYVDTVRILHAKRLLTETDMPIEQIATSVGYDTITSFYRLFKRYTGTAPGEFRQTNP